MAEASHVAERGNDARRKRGRQVDQPRASGVKSVREQMAVRRHLMLGVMRVRAGDTGRDGGDDSTVTCGRWVRVDHREEVARLTRHVTGPHEQIRAR
jgi:hypothetical protein